MANEYVDYNPGNNRHIPKGVEDWLKGLPRELGRVAEPYATLATSGFGIPGLLGAFGQYPTTTTPTWRGKEVASADAKRMALALMLQRQAELSGPLPTTPRAPGVGPLPTTPRAPGYVRPVRPSDQKPRAQGM